MTARLTTLACCAVALLLTFGFPALASAQRAGWDSIRVTKDLPLTRSQRLAFVGSYRVTMPQGGEVSVRVEDEKGKLRLRPEGDAESHAMLHQGENVFLVDHVPDFQLEFVVVNGRATRFTLRKADGLGEGVRAAEAADRAATVDEAAATKDLPLTATERQRYLGIYASELPGGVRITLRILEENGALRLWVPEPDTSMRLLYQGNNVFLMESAPFVLTFDVANDVAMTFKVHKPEGDLTAVRIR